MLAIAVIALKIKLVNILDKITSAGKGDRLPILNDRDHPVYMVHRSAIDKYLVIQSSKNSGHRSVCP